MTPKGAKAAYRCAHCGVELEEGAVVDVNPRTGEVAHAGLGFNAEQGLLEAVRKVAAMAGVPKPFQDYITAARGVIVDHKIPMMKERVLNWDLTPLSLTQWANSSGLHHITCSGYHYTAVTRPTLRKAVFWRGVLVPTEDDRVKRLEWNLKLHRITTPDLLAHGWILKLKWGQKKLLDAALPQIRQTKEFQRING